MNVPVCFIGVPGAWDFHLRSLLPNRIGKQVAGGAGKLGKLDTSLLWWEFLPGLGVTGAWEERAR